MQPAHKSKSKAPRVQPARGEKGGGGGKSKSGSASSATGLTRAGAAVAAKAAAYRAARAACTRTTNSTRAPEPGGWLGGAGAEVDYAVLASASGVSWADDELDDEDAAYSGCGY